MLLPTLLLLLAQAPSAVVVVLDDVAQVDLDIMSAGTPNLAALRAQGVTFRRAYANPTCAPSRWSLQTGHWQVWGYGDPCAPGAGSLDLGESFLPEMVPATAGTAMIGKWHLGASPAGYSWACAPWEHGWDHSYALLGANVTECGSAGYTLWTRADDCLTTTSTAYQPRAACDIVTLGWGTVPGQKLAMVCPNSAHIPFHRPPSNLLPPGYPVTLVGPRPKFEAMIVALDTLIGQMMGALDLQDTYLIVVGDNGTPAQACPPGEGQKAKGTTFERGVRVPLIVAGPGIVSPGRESHQLVHLVDVYQTVIDLMHGGPQTPQADGRSFEHILRDVPGAPLHAMVIVGHKWGTADEDVAAVSTWFKLRRVAQVESFYDMVLDPAETLDLIASPSYAAEVVAHRAFLDSQLP